MSKTSLIRVFTAILALTMIFTACAPAQPTPAPAQPAQPTQPAAAAPTQPAAAPAQPTATQPAAAQPATGGDYANAARKDTVIFDIDGGRVPSPDLFNYLVPGGRRDQGYHQAVLEPLFILNYESGKIEPWQGESMTPNDTLDVWTLKLHKGITWSDGQPFNADDVVFTVNMIKSTEGLAYNPDMVLWVKDVKKVDDLTVEFDLNEPNPRFQLDYFAVKIWGSLTILPKHIWEGQDPLTFKYYDPAKGWPVGTGPYKLNSISETEFSYVRDDNWWAAKTGFQPLPAPQKLIWTWAGPEETRAALMANGGLDSLMDITLGAFQALQAQNPNVIAWFDGSPYAWADPCERTLELNNTVKPWDDPDMRWALNYIIDRDQIIKIAYEGTSQPSKAFFPAYPPLNRYVDLMKDDPNFQNILTHDVAKAQQMIESKGYTKGSDGYYAKDGQQLALDIQTDEAYIEKQRIAQLLVEQLQKAGINATTRNIADATYWDNAAFGKFEAQMSWQTCGSINEPWASMDTLSNRWLKPVGERASGDQWRWDNKEYSDYVAQIGTLPLGDPKIDDLYVKAMTIFYKELPVIPVAQAKKLIPFDTTYWTNWPTAKNNYLHPTTWWQSTVKILVNLKPAK